jgi:hypothetical protein
MSLLSNAKKLEEKVNKEQKEEAEKLIKITDEVVALLKEKDIAVWQIKAVHSLLGQRLTQKINEYVDQKKLNEVL